MDLDECSEAMEEGLEGKTKGACGDDSRIATFMDSPSRLPDILPSNSEEKIPERATGLLISNLFFENKITPDQPSHLTEAKALRQRARLNLPAAFSSYFTTRSSG